MKAKQILSLVLVFALATGFAFKNKQSNTVMIYGVVYTDKCNSENAHSYLTKVVSRDNYYAEQQEMKKKLQDWYPNATRIRMGSSASDYGTASNVCVIKWTNNNNNCSYNVISVLFGKTQQEAINKAISHKKEWADANSPYTILEQKYW